VANLKGPAYTSITEGHIFHVITNGAGLMRPHGSQVSPEDRWKIAKYVKTLQK
jgi:mono/diheme cytochrome c family protein